MLGFVTEPASQGNGKRQAEEMKSGIELDSVGIIIPRSSLCFIMSHIEKYSAVDTLYIENGSNVLIREKKR